MTALYKDKYIDFLIQKINQPKNFLTNTIGDSDENLSRFKNYAQRFSAEQGSRNDSFMKICREGLALSIPHEEILKESVRFIYGNFTQREAQTILDSQIRYHQKSNFKSYSNLENSNGNKCFEVALLIIEQHKENKNNLFTINGHLYKYMEGIYKRVDDDIFLLELRKILNSIPDFKVSQSRIHEVLNNIKSETLSQSEQRTNFFIDVKYEDNFIALKSKVLNVSEALKKVIVLHDLSPNFFSTGKLSFDYDETATCPIFMSILDKVLKDKEDQRTLQCWFAYHLLSNSNFGKLMILIGSGANGKSVILKVLRLFLGEQNVSSVPIERLSNKDRFSAVETFCKLANIADEMSGDGIDEAFIKNFVTGGNIMVEKKYDHPFTFQPTAKLTFSTNIFPKIKDKSDGFWRRLLVLEFKEKIMPDEQRPEYLEDKFWIDSGELAGVFNWVLEGVEYINQHKRIFESANSRKFTQNVQTSSNSIKQWIQENIVFKTASFLDRQTAFDLYRAAMTAQGEKFCTAAEFYKEIEKEFPVAVRQDNAISVNDIKRRGFHNLELITFGTGIF